MSSKIASPEIDFALRMTCEAARLAEEVRTQTVSQATIKQDRSPVTIADFGVQALVAHGLASAFPEDRLVAEENTSLFQDPAHMPLLERITDFVSRFVPGATREAILEWIDYGAQKSSRRFWVLDPVDGTKGFLRGHQYAVALALIEDGVIQAGVLACPNLRDGHVPDPGGPGTLAFAVKGKGAWKASLKNPEQVTPLKVSTCSNPAEAVLLRSADEGHTDVSRTQKLLAAMGTTKPAVEMSSLAKYVVLSGGGGDFLLRLLSPDKPDYREKIWDQAPGAVILREAGGKVTDIDGKELDFTCGHTLAKNRGIFASNGVLHDAILKHLKPLL